MSGLANPNVNRLALHTALHEIANSLSGLFTAVYLLRIGFSPADIFLTFAAIFGLRFLLRPALLFVTPRIGLRWTLVLGATFIAVQYPLLALVHDMGFELALFCMSAAVGQVCYWTSYHAYFAFLSDPEHRGSQVCVRQLLIATAGVVGPAAGGIVLAMFGPLAAFVGAAFAEAIALLPLIGLAQPDLARHTADEAKGLTRNAVVLFATDGWITSCSVWAWHFVMFQSVQERYESFGSMVAIATLAGAIGAMYLGRLIDLGHLGRIAWLSTALVGVGLLVRVVGGTQAEIVMLASIVSAFIGGLYVPVLMTTIYRQARQAPDLFRFVFAIEGGWDIGAFLVCIAAAAIYVSGGTSQLVLALALPVVAAQAVLIQRLNRHGSHESGAEPSRSAGVAISSRS
jgi:MFS family permease